MNFRLSVRAAVLAALLLMLLRVRNIPAVAYYNQVLVQLVQKFPWNNYSWPLQMLPPQQVSPLIDQLTQLCQESQYLPGCPLNKRFRALAGESPTVVLSDAGSGESAELLAVFMADASYGRGEFEQAVTLWMEYLPPAALLSRARATLARGDDEVAVRLVAAIEGELRTGSRRERHEMGVILAQLATRAARQGNHDKAVQLWREAIIHSDEIANYYHGLGTALSHQRNWIEAIAAYSQALRLEPENPNHYVGFAMVYRRQGNERAAAEMARAALELDPDNQAALRLLDQ